MNISPAHTPLVVVTRGVGSAQSVESVHYGSIAVVDAKGHVCWSAGDAHALTFSRSTLKPFQALPFMNAGGVRAMKWGTRETALMCASHSGEEVHSELARTMLASFGCDESHLRCGCHVPLRYTALDITPPKRKWDQTYNNCSGKHAGFLAYCKLTETPLETYLDEGHPLQKAIRASVAAHSGVDESRLVVGIDGCSAPNYALPLANLARLFALLARPEQAGESAESLACLSAAMRAHPELVSGGGRSDVAFMHAFGAPDDGDVVAKIGAGGVQLLGVRSAGLGIAIKIADGNAQALYCAAVAALDQLGLLDDTRRAALAVYARPAIRNCVGTVTGEWRAAFSLARA
ncbi:MAG TPA: asparaginase [Burkholderiaceae bacterium]|nr:asparaginase [Burkholderiaceae bacterium]